ncbi:hypothetical protein GCM10029978_051340 [Actinoallomurus acanthiterrae]
MVASLLVALAGLAQTAVARPPARPARASAAHDRAKPAPPIRAVRVGRIASGDEIVTGSGDSTGWHLYAATAASGWSWRPLATLAPAGINPGGERWTGRQCLTGDGRSVVAVVAPWHADNDPDGLIRGGLAYVIDAHTGAVRPLTAGVSLFHATPSCGSDGTVALTRYTTPDLAATELLRADTAHARVESVQRVRGELTDATPAPSGGVYAVRGGAIVRVAGGGRPSRLVPAGSRSTSSRTRPGASTSSGARPAG